VITSLDVGPTDRVAVLAGSSHLYVELDAHARRSIVGFKVPWSWTLQAEPLPMSAAAKVLKRELREREAARCPPR
jgi:acyl-CoA synthetase (AMP-forming)/AMP-acid ligase II